MLIDYPFNVCMCVLWFRLRYGLLSVWLGRKWRKDKRNEIWMFYLLKFLVLKDGKFSLADQIILLKIGVKLGFK
jgi:hypothetical protein